MYQLCPALARRLCVWGGAQHSLLTHCWIYFELEQKVADLRTEFKERKSSERR